MYPNQARSHLKILSSRVTTLQDELKIALQKGKQMDEKYQNLRNELASIDNNHQERVERLNLKFEEEANDYKKQIKLAEGMLEKKKEERDTLLDYLNSLDLTERKIEDIRDFDWSTLTKIAESLNKEKNIGDKTQKAEYLAKLNQKARARVSELSELIESTLVVKQRSQQTYGNLNDHLKEWKKIQADQEKHIHKIQCENERINMLIKQCVVSNEPMSEFVTKNVQAKCQSFINSESPQELLKGLKKFKARQDRIIKLLQHKDNKLDSQINLLQVAKDQTHAHEHHVGC